MYNFDRPGGSGTNRPSTIRGTATRRTLPAWADRENEYGELIVLRLEAEKGELPKNPFVIRASVEKCVDGKIAGAFPENRGERYSLKIRSEAQATKLLLLDQLLDGTKIKVSSHPTLNTSKCIVTCRDVIEISETDLKAELAEQGVVDVKRFTRKSGNESIDTPTILLTIKGTATPDHIDFGYIRVKTRPYYPSPVVCYRCYDFGHTRTRCGSDKIVCGNCSANHETDSESPCTQQPFCKRCQSGDHKVGSKACPAYRKEAAILKIKTNGNLSYPAARNVFDAENGISTYANITSSGTRNATEELIRKVKEQEEQIKALKTALGKSQVDDQTKRTKAATERESIENLEKEKQQLAGDLKNTNEENAKLKHTIEQMKKWFLTDKMNSEKTVTKTVQPAAKGQQQHTALSEQPKQQQRKETKIQHPKTSDQQHNLTTAKQQQRESKTQKTKRNAAAAISDDKGVKPKLTKINSTEEPITTITDSSDQINDPESDAEFNELLNYDWS